MKEFRKVQGSGVQAVPLIVGKTTVYVHTNIRKIEEPDPETGEVPTDLYEYDEIQYTKDEYIKVQHDALEVTKEAVDFLLMEGA